jgi:hypothetical protein
VLFALMGFLVDSGKRLSSTADMQVGDGNQYAQVGTTLALLERGSMVMSSIHKRLHYAQTLEFRLLFEGFGQYLPDEYPYDVPGASRRIKKKDFDTMVSVQPVADPNIFSSAQRIQLAQMQLQLAQSAPQMHNLYEAYYRVYAAMNVRDIDGILKPQSNQMPKDPATENADVLDTVQLKAFAGQQHDAHIVSHLIMGLSPMIGTNPMAAMMLQKHILEHVRLKAEEAVEAELFMEYGTDPDRMVSAIQKEGMIAIKCTIFMQEVRNLQQQLQGGGGGQDPVVMLKAQELELRAQRDQADAAAKQKSLQIQEQKVMQTAADAQARIQSQENIAQLRANVAQQRLAMTQQRGGRNAA